MNSRKRPAAEPLLPLHSAKQPRTRMVGYDGGNPSPSEVVGLLSRWKSIWKDFGDLAIETGKAATAIFYRPQRMCFPVRVLSSFLDFSLAGNTVEDSPPSIPNESDANQPVSNSHFPDGNTFKFDAPSSQKIRGLEEPNLLSYSPSTHSHHSISKITTQPPQARPIPESSTCYTHNVFTQVNRSQSSQRQHQCDTMPRKIRPREHIFAKAVSFMHLWRFPYVLNWDSA